MEKLAVVEIDREELCRVGYRIKLVRLRKNMTQTELADAIGISKAHISNIENGKTIVTMENLFLIKKALGCDFMELLSYEKQEEKHDNKISMEDLVLALGLLKNRNR